MMPNKCRKRGLKLFITIGFLVNMLLVIAPLPGSATVFKYATILPQNGPGAGELSTLMKKIRRETNGEVNFQMFGDAIAGDEADIIHRMESNRIQLAAMSGVGLGKIVSAVRVLEAPGLFRNYTEADLVRRKMFDVFAADFANRGYILLGLGDAGFVHAYSKKDISTPGSFNELQMWTWKGDPLSQICIQELGMQVVPMNITDVNQGLDMGLINAFYAPALAATSFQWGWKINYVLDYPLTSVTGAMLMLKKAFDDLSPQSQNILRKEMRTFSDEGVYVMRERNMHSVKLMQEQGLKIVRPSKAQMDIIEKAFARTIEKQISMSIFSEQLYNQIRKILEEQRAAGDVPDYSITSEEIPKDFD